MLNLVWLMSLREAWSFVRVDEGRGRSEGKRGEEIGARMEGNCGQDV